MKNIDKIVIKNIRCHGILGINPEERIDKQAILVNVMMEADTSTAAYSKNIEDAVNYFDAATKIKQFVESAEALLVETLVNNLANLILDSYPTVECVMVRVEKPEAVEFADSVGVEIVRVRG
ncbi:MAG: dihydroneopterin aldolase [Cellvibrionaceae bacterium]|jgi:dihydroneopterin aldolase